ncbi:gliding motility-associated C-terminal domain-containing protein [Chitinophaga horti]|uniref:Gliding motility-associated C-terminal domain-containing protein n=1 Tax=Chitinophaga horti TaxID=2920382 RepID=A0ABY6IX28_9BACT|nr:gliding motility-associated C-terminal domain-containing protein [Chitinophaga horti]UYQ91935.1 gliding motility-associated C-terminal domain-containing protein [Chitinophaga horti]
MQASVATCGGKRVYGASCGTLPLDDRYPYWYKFTCFKAGTLGLEITPNDIGDDYDWQIWDVTGHDVNEVYNPANKMTIVANWSGEPGVTGASAAGTSLNVCGGTGQNLWSRMPTLIEGHEYLLLVSHFTPTQSGYTLEFKGGTASITDTLTPAMKSALYRCGPYTVTVKLNKKMRCSTLAADGSDFTIASGAANITGASSVCAGFDMDSVVLQLDRPMPPGTHSVVVKQGTDGNTILDICGNGIAVGSTMDFFVETPVHVPYDSLSRVGCSPTQLRVVFRDNVRCSSIAANGSDFALTGNAAVWITGASTVNCSNDLTRELILSLNAPINLAGAFTLTLQRGTDGNSLISECHVETPVGGTRTFNTLPPVTADFTYNLTLACNGNNVGFFHDGNNFTDTWHWFVDGAQVSAIQNPGITFVDFHPKEVVLAVSNGICADTASQEVTFANFQEAKFSMMRDLLCPADFGVFRNESEGNIIGYRWEFGNGTTSDIPNPRPQLYPDRTQRERQVPVLLITENDYHCLDTATQFITLVNSCFTDVPTAFTPNGDGLNDFLYPLNGYKTKELDFRVFNRAGNEIFHSTSWTRRWDGTVNGRKADVGTYAWTLRYVNSETGEKFFLKGTSVLIR